MTNYPHLSNAPIAEAILDIRVDAGTGDSLAAVQVFAEAVRADFPEQKPVQVIDGFFEMAPDRPAKAQSKATTLGQICWNSAKTRAVQARIDGFTINHVRHYGSWVELRDCARKMWPRYVEIVKPKGVIRIALRYINKLEFPPGDDLSNHLQTKLLLAQSLPQHIGESFIRVDLHFESERRAFITEATQPATPEQARPKLLLDIDAYVSRPMAASDPKIWEELEALHDIKNRCFFESLRPETWRAYQ
jgi:uncharacterized protein (TIGR04255 family)